MKFHIDTLKTLIVETLRDMGELESEKLEKELERMYATAQVPFPWDQWDEAIHSLRLARKIRQRETEWEDELFYSAIPQKPKKPRKGAKRQQVLSI